jgi:hypothetical protein
VSPRRDSRDPPRPLTQCETRFWVIDCKGKRGYIRLCIDTHNRGGRWLKGVSERGMGRLPQSLHDVAFLVFRWFSWNVFCNHPRHFIKWSYAHTEFTNFLLTLANLYFIKALCTIIAEILRGLINDAFQFHGSNSSVAAKKKKTKWKDLKRTAFSLFQFQPQKTQSK